MIYRDVNWVAAASIKTVGVISDTHNLLRPEAIEKLKGSGLIIHAGDIGERSILERLEMIAPVVAVRGNVDRAEWCRGIPLTMTVSIGKVKIYVIHNLKELDKGLLDHEVKAVISGHSHQPRIEIHPDCLYLNPGSAGRRRFRLPISIARIEIDGRQITGRIIELNV